jgi:hypothetical protein
MNRPQKIHPPVKGAFGEILAAVAMGSGKGKCTAKELQRKSIKSNPSKPSKKTDL